MISEDDALGIAAKVGHTLRQIYRHDVREVEPWTDGSQVRLLVVMEHPVDPAPSDYQPEPQHVSRIAARMAEQIQMHHDPAWDFGDITNRTELWRHARWIAEMEDRAIANMLMREVKP